MGFLYYILGVVGGVLAFCLLYPLLKTLPLIILHTIAGKLRMTALLNVFLSFCFALGLFSLVLFVISFFTPVVSFVSRPSVVFGLFSGVVLSYITPGGASAMREDYADFFKRHMNAPLGVADIHIAFAVAYLEYYRSNFGESQKAVFYSFLDSFENSSESEHLIISALKFAGASDDEIIDFKYLYEIEKQTDEVQKESEVIRSQEGSSEFVKSILAHDKNREIVAAFGKFLAEDQPLIHDASLLPYPKKEIEEAMTAVERLLCDEANALLKAGKSEQLKKTEINLNAIQNCQVFLWAYGTVEPADKDNVDYFNRYENRDEVPDEEKHEFDVLFAKYYTKGHNE